MKLSVKLLLFASFVLIIMLLLVQENGECGLRRCEMASAQVIKTLDPVVVYQNAITYPQEDLKVQLVGLKTLLEMGEKMPGMYIYETWKNELNNRLNSIALDFQAIMILIPPESEKARHDQYSSAESEFLEAEELILGGINIGDQGMINQGREILDGIAY